MRFKRLNEMVGLYGGSVGGYLGCRVKLVGKIVEVGMKGI